MSHPQQVSYLKFTQRKGQPSMPMPSYVEFAEAPMHAAFPKSSTVEPSDFKSTDHWQYLTAKCYNLAGELSTGVLQLTQNDSWNLRKSSLRRLASQHDHATHRSRMLAAGCWHAQHDCYSDHKSLICCQSPDSMASASSSLARTSPCSTDRLSYFTISP